MGFVIKKSRRRGLAKKQKALKKLKEWQKNQRNHTKKEGFHGKRQNKTAGVDEKTQVDTIWGKARRLDV